MPTQSQQYETVAASQTGQVIGVTGGKGDYLESLIIVPEAAAAGAVTIIDGATSIIVFVGGAVTALTDLRPVALSLRMYSASGAWSITTGASVHVIAIGSFTL